ncbi:MAG: hypothetical protein ACOYOF_16440 [Verrucomicrobiaceae bacterium]|jgi:hypothetical protein
MKSTRILILMLTAVIGSAGLSEAAVIRRPADSAQVFIPYPSQTDIASGSTGDEKLNASSMEEMAKKKKKKKKKKTSAS